MLKINSFISEIIKEFFMSAISNEERARRLVEIKRLQNDGKTDYFISKKLSLPIQTIKREIKYLELLSRGDISPEELAEKRSELYIELVEATEEAKKLFELYKRPSLCPMCDGEGYNIIDEKFVKSGIIYNEGDKFPCSQCKGLGALHRTVDADRFFKSWLETIEKKAALFGLNNVKSEGFTVNQQFNSLDMTGVEKVSGEAARIVNKLKDSIINEHENNVRDK